MSLQALIVAQALVPSNPSICCSVVNSEHSSATRRPCQQLPQASLRNASLRAANVEQVSTLFSGGGDKNNNGRVGGGGDGGGGGGSSGGSGGSHGGFEDQSGVPLVHVTAWSLLWARYMENLDRHPLVVKSLTAGCLNALADLICQVFVEKVDTVEIKRLLSFVAIGIFMSGPGLHYCLSLLFMMKLVMMVWHFVSNSHKVWNPFQIYYCARHGWCGSSHCCRSASLHTPWHMRLLCGTPFS
ncbi:hypothetical protein BDL97_05G038200 [Sphagnum fallax]|nr:hypothetical protein BDL97_05G038200 [Sphagnum fallax]